jgi:hypothetical protein
MHDILDCFPQIIFAQKEIILILMSEIEVVKNFNYLGIIFSKTGNFNLAKKRLVDKAVVSMYAVLRIGSDI